MKTLPVGKLSSKMLGRLIGKYCSSSDKRIAVGPAIGEDAAVIDFGDKYLVAKTDPVTFTTEETGWYAVNINANDIAVRGAKPRWFMSSILLPENLTSETLVEKIFSQIADACNELDISVTGGHTEITHDIHRPVIAGCMFGEVRKDKLITTSGAKTGDAIIITKGIVIEGTSIIASMKEKELLKRGYSRNFIEKSKKYVHRPGISVVKDALLACDTVPVHCMHDPTEGGLAQGLYEIAYASETGLYVEENAIPILREAGMLCREFSLDPMGTLTSGTLVVTVAPEYADRLIEAYHQKKIPACVIGYITKKGMKIKKGGKTVRLRHSETDEITKLFKESSSPFQA